MVTPSPGREKHHHSPMAMHFFLATKSQELLARGPQGCHRLHTEHPNWELGPSLHSYLCPGAADPGNEAMCVRQQVGGSPGAVPTSQTRFKARASSTERHRDLFLLPSLTLPSARSLRPAGLGAALAARGGEAFPAAPLPPAPWHSGGAAGRCWHRSDHTLCRGHPCALCPRAVACRAAPRHDGHVPAETHQLIAPGPAGSWGGQGWRGSPGKRVGTQHQTCSSASPWPGLRWQQGAVSLVTVMKLRLEARRGLRM